MRSTPVSRSAVLLAAALTPASVLFAQAFPDFESPQTHAVAVSPDGTRLFAVNTPDNRLAVFDLRDPRQPRLLGEVPVGLEPVAVAARTDGEVWVACHLSDAVSVVDVAALETVATLACSDEPADVVFAQGRAFVSCATRREVLVFDAATRREVGRVPVFADEPRAMAATVDRVFVASARSGNGTTILPAAVAPPPPPPTNAALPAAPQTGLIVRSDDPLWAGRLPFAVPDWDVFEIDAQTLGTTRHFAGVGTILLGLAVAPGGGALWVTNTEARNAVRFEPALRGHVVDNRVTRITLGAPPAVTPFDLNPGIDYNLLPNPAALAVALAQPAGVVFAPDGAELYVAAFGTDRIGVLDGAGSVIGRIEVGGTPGSAADPRHKRGPRALAHHPAQPLLYVLNRLSNTLTVVDAAARAIVRELDLVCDPTPAAVKEGRGFLYDAKLSGNGTAACAACHIDAVHDGLAWDLGDPGGQLTFTPLAGGGSAAQHPMKGPMLTQSLQGLSGTEPLHWRGDRPDFASFAPLFASLLGGAPLPSADMDAFAAFAAAVRYPPNPNEPRDRILPATPVGTSAQDGLVFFLSDPFFLPGELRCIDCHASPAGTNRSVLSAALLSAAQAFKVPHLRGIYKRIPERNANGESTAGFGITHDGERFDVVDMHSRTISHLYDGSEKLQAYLATFETEMAPAVGLTRTIDQQGVADPAVAADWTLLESRALLRDCDLVLRGRLDGAPAGFLFRSATLDYESDAPGAAPVSRAQIEQWLGAGRARLVLLGTPFGQGRRIGLDRDGDGVADGGQRPADYGAPTQGCSLRLRGNSPSLPGNVQFALVAEGAPAGGSGVVLIGLQPASVLLAGVGVLVAPGNAAAVAAPADARGVGFAALPIPAMPSLSGLQVFGQAFYPAPCGPQGIAASNGVRVTVQ